jgi:hypothetical protein
MALTPCQACDRHVRAGDPRCPFCGADRAPSASAAPLALALAMSGLVACGGEGTPTAASDKASAKPAASASAAASATTTSSAASAPTATASSAAEPSATASAGASGTPSAQPTATQDDRPRAEYGMPVPRPDDRPRPKYGMPPGSPTKL